MKEYYVCMVVYLQILMIYHKLMKYKGLRMYLIKEFYVICFGQIQII